MTDKSSSPLRLPRAARCRVTLRRTVGISSVPAHRFSVGRRLRRTRSAPVAPSPSPWYRCAVIPPKVSASAPVQCKFRALAAVAAYTHGHVVVRFARARAHEMSERCARRRASVTRGEVGGERE